jgi:FkbM family methyltransferase
MNSRILNTAKRAWHWFTRLACKNRDVWFYQGLDRLAIRYHADFENQNYDVFTNGEKRVLETLQIIAPRCLLDVGANTGDWTVLAQSIHPSATIHSFEIAPPTYEQLKTRVGDLTHVSVHDFGLGAKEATISINYAPDETTVSSAISTDFRYGKTVISTEPLEARIMRGDTFLETHAIPRVDYLKIDVEGMEDQVLAGFQEALSNGRVTAVQFEYGMVNIATHFLLADFYLLFRKLGYEVGKIYPNYVDFSGYDYTKENFIGGNFVAVHKTYSALISALQSK